MTAVFGEKDHSVLYSKFRPTYPQELYDRIMEYHRESVSRPGSQCGFERAIDLGCGTGQSIRPLLQYFENVLGVDESASQIEMARKQNPDISFKVGMGENMSFLPDGSDDLVTIAAAIHWMDWNAVFSELKRVLKVGGTVAVYVYRYPILQNPEAERLFYQLRMDTLGSYWDAKRIALPQSDYRELDFPFAEIHRYDDIRVQKTMSVDNLIGFVESLSAYRAYMKANPTSRLLEETKTRFLDILGHTDQSCPTDLELENYFVLLIGRNL